MSSISLASVTTGSRLRRRPLVSYRHLRETMSDAAQRRPLPVRAAGILRTVEQKGDRPQIVKLVSPDRQAQAAGFTVPWRFRIGRQRTQHNFTFIL
jgi:hypothetical protein